MKKVDDKDFELANLPVEAQDPEIKSEDFILQDSENAVHEQRFQTKPTTFFKDSMRRFAKNKSSVVAAGILGILILLAIFVPIISPYDVSKPQDAALTNLEPKLFDSAGGFWDGTKNVEHVSLYYDDVKEAWLPNQEIYPVNGIIGGKNGIKVGEPEYTNTADKLGLDGYALVGYFGSNTVQSGRLNSANPFEFYTADLVDKKFKLNLSNSTLTLNHFEVFDLAKIKEAEGNDKELPQGYVLGKTTLQFNYWDADEKAYVPVDLVSRSFTHDINVDDGTQVELNSTIIAETGMTIFDKFFFSIAVYPDEGTPVDANVCGLIKNMVIHDSYMDNPPIPGEDGYTDAQKDIIDEIEFFSINLDDGLNGISFDNAMTFIARTAESGYGMRTKNNRGFWSTGSPKDYSKGVYLGKCRFGSFTYDSYEGTLGVVEGYDELGLGVLKGWSRYRWLTYKYDYHLEGDTPILDEFWIHPNPKYKGICPIVENVEMEDVISVSYVQGGIIINYRCTVLMYRILGFDEMPKFIFGTDKAGRDMFKYVFEGLRNSLGLGVLTFAVCFIFGLIWGAISGYFGGNVDLVMERLTDILSGMPWVVLMTIIVMHMGRNFTSFAIALCLTGWIGTASTTRTQFYRFRGREYVLASRTLGASDARLIAKHILPNAMGTIITGAVLMIPSVIFSEATLAYLGLGFMDRSSLGVILSNNQAQLFNHPYQLIFPSVVISLVMISFNLFGNGLRDAINPSLKGEGE